MEAVKVFCPKYRRPARKAHSLRTWRPHRQRCSDLWLWYRAAQQRRCRYQQHVEPDHPHGYSAHGDLPRSDGTLQQLDCAHSRGSGGSAGDRQHQRQPGLSHENADWKLACGGCGICSASSHPCRGKAGRFSALRRRHRLGARRTAGPGDARYLSADTQVFGGGR